MKKEIYLRTILFLMISFYSCTVVLSQEQRIDFSLPEEDKTPDTALVVVDVIPIRVLGLAVTIVGTGLFVVTLPFTFFMDTDKNSESGISLASDALIFKPMRFTFTRPLGKFDRWDQDYDQSANEESDQ